MLCHDRLRHRHRSSHRGDRGWHCTFGARPASFLRVNPVKIEVVGNDETKTAGESPSLAFAPIFRVIEGAHDGKEWRSSVFAGPAPQYRIGDMLDGWLDPKSGEIHTSGTKHA